MATGRRPLLETQPGLLDKLCKDIETYGCSIKDACLTTGISEDAYHLWRQKGEAAYVKREQGERISKREAMYLGFIERTANARLEAKKRNLLLIQNHARTDPKSAMWYLEHAHPQEFALANKVMFDGPGGAGSKGEMKFKLTWGESSPTKDEPDDGDGSDSSSGS